MILPIFKLLEDLSRWGTKKITFLRLPLPNLLLKHGKAARIRVDDTVIIEEELVVRGQCLHPEHKELHRSQPVLVLNEYV